jgi:Ser/Thr protein kinase RdoA (MazF antagonist)
MDDITAARAALEAWGSIVGGAQLEPLPLVTNPLWKVITEDGRELVLKQLPEFAPGVGPVHEFRVTSYLQSAGIPVAPPIITDNAGINTLVGERYFSLIPFVRNDSGNHETGPGAAATSYAIGAAIGQLDMALADCPWAVPSYVDDPVNEILGEALGKLPEEAGEPVAPYVDRLRAAVSGLPTQRTHGDCNSGNVLVHNGQVSGMIDLDHLPIGPRVRDLSYYLASRLRSHLAQPATAGRDAAAMVTVLGHYVAGYHASYPLSERELAAVVPLMLLVEIGHASWCVHGWVPSPQGYRQSVLGISWITARLDDLTAAAAAV